MDDELDGQQISVFVDREKIGQVLDNLLHNALKYTPEKGIVCVQLLEPQEGHAILAVIDTGPGIPEDDLRDGRIFQRFHRGASNRGEGSGLGLAIVRELVEQHGGSVGVDSRVGKGTTFAIELPLTAEPGQSAPL